ncbi:1-(5-phosphoribosyl)-5-[(5-phosphoribosylamino)methylideneamino]imidazole-4-carboxamide isomerase [Caldibacillus lycopersici]|uniref:1-(5-phosphoribosyl)-5-[(5-phosphoribosylamino)methylideneamino] imidazole-4-carboxamide isomerase n=1 Tax=Perspicuibacillus lycopersici TaxID=1325689 RepID=A0AAE3ISG7_9BACI|nr:1-(5-phosphoribosyl)-5-[(5-phosphoribosylamino)methylideneamino]imidazole-4-carboxamide isomerase [Perspicuibacillus lycopersici]MCU9613790.1 1-(5-phosphoribosyl)-5-[(5-phosphoribosylamino)methylideneamino]imidazole-4-carboxamide isomerase [Perspicuibacillus lycopersici]
MILFPAIDIRNGKCVRLIQGDYGKEAVYGDPLEMAKKWATTGAQFLHIVDLDGALIGTSQNLEIIEAIVQVVDIPVQVGGGIRSLEQIERLLAIGVKRVILGSAALGNEELLTEALKRYSESIAVSIDAKNGFVATDGWTKTSTETAVSFAKKLEEKGLQTIIYTDIAKDGMLAGPNFAELDVMNNATKMNVIASGGVSTTQDLAKLEQLQMYGAIIGKALYTGQLDLQLALKEVSPC